MVKQEKPEGFARIVGPYRYSLERVWGDTGHVCWIMLNPSTADADQDDPTIRRCMAFTRAWGYGSLSVVNLFALRATDPRALRTVHDPVGPENDATIKSIAGLSDLIVAAWGVHGVYRDRDRVVRTMLSNLQCLGRTKDGLPRHPLYVRGDVKPQPFK